MDLPKELFELYRQGVLTRDEFKAKFSEWQKSNGYNDVKGGADKRGVYIEYKGERAWLEGNVLLYPPHGYFWDEHTNVEAFTAKDAVKAFTKYVDWLKKERAYDVDRTSDGSDARDRLIHVTPDSEYFNYLTPKEKAEYFSHH